MQRYPQPFLCANRRRSHSPWENALAFSSRSSDSRLVAIPHPLPVLPVGNDAGSRRSQRRSRPGFAPGSRILPAAGLLRRGALETLFSFDYIYLTKSSIHFAVCQAQPVPFLFRSVECRSAFRKAHGTAGGSPGGPVIQFSSRFSRSATSCTPSYRSTRTSISSRFEVGTFFPV